MEIQNFLTSDVKTGIKIAFILFGFWAIGRIIKISLSKATVFTHAAPSTRILLRTFIQILLILLCTLIVLDTLGISITPLLASLGVGSLAVALALQDTLNNFFSGLYLLIDKPARIGDLVKIDGNFEGTVKKIGWRTTRVELQSGSMLIMPNSKFALSNLQNYDYPNREMSVTISLGVAYNSNLDNVEKITLQVAKEVLNRVPGGMKDTEPSFRYNQFADFRVNFNVVLKVESQADSYLLRHEFIKALHLKYKEARVEIPFPQRIIQINKEDSKI